ncbi:MAG: type II secretion system F family protein [Bifidobacteriaceae bacterium]|jgi:type IV pilus assembly protein PilC|nr:type II secretion system F family protein [Bifidobacteriaceae bacterium]
MPVARTFEYTVMDTAGKKRVHRIEAPNDVAVATHLRERGMVAVAIHEVNTGGLNREISFGSGIKPKDVVVMTRQLSTMVSSGLSLLRAINILAEQTRSAALARVMLEIAGVIENGGTLADGFAQHPRVFSPVIIAMIRAGESGGFLDQVLATVADNMESEIKLRRTVKGAMTYPVLVVAFMLIIVTVMLLVVVPTFADIFASLDHQLPAPTLAVIALSNVMKIVGPIVIVAAIGIGVWWSKNKNLPAVRAKVDPIKLSMPLFGSLMTKVALARFCRNFSTMTRVGVPVVKALDIVGDTSGNMVIADAVKRVKDLVTRGEPIGRAMSTESIFPPMIRQMVSVGEDAGSLDTMLGKVADFYDDEVTTATAALTSMIEPLLIIVVGAVVGGLLIALYLPIFELSSALE